MTTIDKSMQVLDLLSAQRWTRLADLAEAIDIPKPTVHRLLRNLAEGGLAKQGGDGRWQLNDRVFALAARAFHDASPDRRLRSVVIELSRRIRLTVHLSVFHQDQLLYVDKLEADTTFKMRSQVGRIQAIHSSAIGRSVLARLPESEAHRLVSKTPLTSFEPAQAVDVDGILRSLPTVREAGYALDDEEDEPGTRAIGAAFAGPDGTPRGGFSLVAPAFSSSRKELIAHAPALLEAVRTAELLLADQVEDDDI